MLALALVVLVLVLVLVALVLVLELLRPQLPSKDERTSAGCIRIGQISVGCVKHGVGDQGRYEHEGMIRIGCVDACSTR